MREHIFDEVRSAVRYHPFPLSETRLRAPVQALSIASVVLMIIAIFATRSRLVDFPVSIALLSFACASASAAFFLSLVGMMDIWEKGRQGFGKLLLASALSILVLAMPIYYTVLAFRLPPISDVSTDLDERPAFSQSSLALSKREGYTHSQLKDGIDDLQRQAYPAIRPFILELPVDEAVPLVREALNALKWRMMLEIPPNAPNKQMPQGQAGYIEALRESPVLRLKTDLIVRVQPIGQNVRIDMRFASRLLNHDFGENAALIQRLQREIKALQD